MPRTVKAWPVILAAALLPAFPASAQDDDLLNPPDAPTRIAEHANPSCTLEGIQVLKKENGKNPQDVNIVFLLTEKPSVYFNYYDAGRKAVVFDFYDTHIGESLMDSIHEPPITTSSVEPSRVDLNRDVAGLKPDFRDVVRVSLYTPRDFEYDVREEDNVITLSFKWNGRWNTALKPQKTAFYWQFPLALVTAAGVGFTTYELLKKPAAKTQPPPCCSGRPLR